MIYNPVVEGFVLALEEDTTGTMVNEKEFTVYAQLLDFKQLATASRVTKQEQWNIFIPKTDKNAVQGSIRVRKVEEEGKETEYHLTTKVKKGEGDKLECTVITSEDNFMQFAFLANDGMIKERYEFPIPDTEFIWELDVYKKPDGTMHSWCRLDLEVDDLEMKLPPLPIEFGEVILPEGYGDIDPKERQDKINTLYDTVFRSDNKFIKEAEATEEPAA